MEGICTLQLFLGSLHTAGWWSAKRSKNRRATPSPLPHNGCRSMW